MKFNWTEDPNTKNPSVSLTLVFSSFILLVAAAGLEISGLTKTTSVLPEMFYSACALYFGRRFNVNNKTYSSEKAEEVETKIEKV